MKKYILLGNKVNNERLFILFRFTWCIIFKWY